MSRSDISNVLSSYYSRQLVVDRSLASLPKRQTDEATILRVQDGPTGKAQVFKMNVTAGDPVLIERYVFRSFTILLVSNNCTVDHRVVTNGSIVSIAPGVV